MLKTLSIENIAVIEKSDIEFSSGLNVLTGETGAGKSIVVDSINAILGERTSKTLIRNGADSAYISAVFEEINDEVKAKLIEYDIPIEDDIIILSRRINTSGKSSCRINGVMCTAAMLKDIGTSLVNIHGQHDSQSLLNPEFHYRFVDMYAGNDKLLEEYRNEFKKLLSVRKKLKSLTLDADARDKEIELLDYQIKELTQADIKIGEWEQLKKRKSEIENAQKIISALNTTLASLNGGDDYSGVSTLVSTAIKENNQIENDNEILSIKDKLIALENDIEVIKDEAISKLSSMEFSDDEPERIEERLNLLYSFSNKYGETEEDMLYYLDEAVRKRELFDNSEAELEILNKEYDEIFNSTVNLAEKLTANRKSASEKLCKEVCEQLEFLNMPKIKFTTSFAQGNLSSNGTDKIEFLISTNPGEPPKPLSKIASGGELSRIMLSIKSIIARNDSIETLIFDEIDTGVSGKASRKIGLKLRDVSKFAQVICVTHSAQIASVANNHYLIEKEYQNDRTYTKVSLLDYDARKRELARIMGGLEITQALLTSAEEMLNEQEIVFI